MWKPVLTSRTPSDRRRVRPPVRLMAISLVIGALSAPAGAASASPATSAVASAAPGVATQGYSPGALSSARAPSCITYSTEACN